MNYGQLSGWQDRSHTDATREAPGRPFSLLLGPRRALVQSTQRAQWTKALRMTFQEASCLIFERVLAPRGTLGDNVIVLSTLLGSWRREEMGRGAT